MFQIAELHLKPLTIQRLLLLGGGRSSDVLQFRQLCEYRLGGLGFLSPPGPAGGDLVAISAVGINTLAAMEAASTTTRGECEKQSKK